MSYAEAPTSGNRAVAYSFDAIRNFSYAKMARRGAVLRMRRYQLVATARVRDSTARVRALDYFNDPAENRR
jgi:hypothetical protein